jgi:hypothetical protein
VEQLEFGAARIDLGVVDSEEFEVVAGGGIEPPTQGFSVLNRAVPKRCIRIVKIAETPVYIGEKRLYTRGQEGLLISAKV